MEGMALLGKWPEVEEILFALSIFMNDDAMDHLETTHFSLSVD